MAETVGWLADKISIMELKIYHMSEQAERTDCGARVPRAVRDRASPCSASSATTSPRELTTLLADIAAGRVVPKVYRQFKMYNDPRYRATTRRGAIRPRGSASPSAPPGRARRAR